MKQSNKSRIFLPAALLMIALAAGVALAASPPAIVNYQGVLRDDQNLPLDGSFDMTFRFFDTENVGTGNEIMIDAHVAAGSGDVTVNGGLFEKSQTWWTSSSRPWLSSNPRTRSSTSWAGIGPAASSGGLA